MKVLGAEELPGHANYFIGNDPKQWHTDVPTYAQVKYQSVYPGIDLVYYGSQSGQLEYDFVVSPDADPGAIILSVEAGLVPAKGRPQGSHLRVEANGDLVIPTEGEDLLFHKPVVYQLAGEQRSVLSGQQVRSVKPESRVPNPESRTVVDGHYVLTASNHVRFALGPYDHSRPLIIDPYLSYSTYVGGTGGDIGYAISVDVNNDAYITGVTNSTNFPTKGAEQGTYGGKGDAFVSKLNNVGGALLYSTYIGGSGSDAATAIFVSAGDAYITGNTNSTNFPTTDPLETSSPPVPPYQITLAGTTNAFVTELGTIGNKLVFSTYLGGSGSDFGQGIAVDSTGNVYVTGSTQSTNFPTVTPYQAGNAGNGDAFITVVNVTGTALLYSTYLGGSQADVAQALAITTSGTTSNVYVSGYTFSSNFPTAGTPFQAANAGAPNCFAAELTISNLGTASESSALTFSTYLGGSGNDRAMGIALDGSGNVYLTGETTSTDFPTSTGAFQTSNAGPPDAFVAELNTTGSSLVYGTYLGGSGADQGNAIVVDSSGDAFVTGFTQSSNFPLANAIQPLLNLGISSGTLCGTSGAPCSDAFITEVPPGGGSLTYSTFLGGSGPDFGQGIALDSTGLAYITGSTSSINFPAIAGAFQSSLNGVVGDAFVAKVDTADHPTIAIVPGSINFGNQTLSVVSPQQQITVINPSTETLDITATAFNKPTNASNPSTSVAGFAETNTCLGSIPAGGTCTINVTFTPPSVSSETDQLTITDNAWIAGSASTTQTITFTGTGITAATAVTVTPTTLTFANQTIATPSAPQNVTIENTGTGTLNITGIGFTGETTDFSQTNTCGALQNTLAVGQSCTISVTFTPAASGTRSASLTISDNATGSPQSVSLTGTGLAQFTLTSPQPDNNNPVLIGATSTTFGVVANGPSSFTGSISLSCSVGTTCAFSPASIGVGATSTLTVSNLTTSMPDPYIFTVTGVSGTEAASVQLNLLFHDFSLTVTPPVFIVEAGGSAQYTVLVNPLNGLNGQQINLGCEKIGFPPAATCSFSNSTPSPASVPSSILLTIFTQKYVSPTYSFPRPPWDNLPPWLFGLLSLGALASLGLSAKRRARRGLLSARWLGVRLATICVILVLNLTLGSCRPSVLAVSGTTTGSYTITISGTLNSNQAVVRTAVVNLSVTAPPP